MSPDVSANPTKLCPTCGTRVSAEAVRCLVCGSDLSGVSQAVAVGGGEGKVALARQPHPGDHPFATGGHWLAGHLLGDWSDVGLCRHW